MNGDFAQGGTITFTADLPQEVIDKVLANTKEDMDKWLEAGNTFDLSDGHIYQLPERNKAGGRRAGGAVRRLDTGRAEELILYAAISES